MEFRQSAFLMLERQKKTSFPFPYISWHAYGSDGMADGLVRRCCFTIGIFVNFLYRIECILFELVISCEDRHLSNTIQCSLDLNSSSSSAGCKTMNGQGMMLFQAIAAIELILGKRVDSEYMKEKLGISYVYED